MTLFLDALIFFPKILLGFVIVNFLWKDFDFSAVFLKLGIGIPLGMAISASVFFITLLAGITPSIYSQIEFWGALLIALFLLAKQLSPRLGSMRLGLSWQDILGMLIVFAGAILSVYAFIFYTRMHPYGFADARSIWNLTARYIYRSNSGDVLTHSEFYPRFHPDYPLELSLNVAWGWLFLKSETTHLPISLSLLLTYSPVVLIWAALKKWKGAIPAALGALILFMSVDFRYAIAQYADTLLALHMLSAFILLYGYLRSHDNNLLLLAGFLTSSSAWVKNEGLLFLAVLGAVCTLATWKSVIRWNALKLFWLGSIPPLLVVAAYKLATHWESDLFSGGGSLKAKILDITRWQLIGQNFVTRIAGYGNWPISVFIVLIIYSVFVGISRDESRRRWWLLLVIGGQLAGYFCIYLITPHDLLLHIDTSMNRLILQVYPLIMFWIFAAIQPPNLAFISSRVKADEAPQSEGNQSPIA